MRRDMLVLENTTGADVAEKLNFDLVVFSFKLQDGLTGRLLESFNSAHRGLPSRPPD